MTTQLTAESMFRLPWDKVSFTADGTEAPGHVFLHASGLAACMLGLKPTVSGENREALVAHQVDVASASATTFSVGDPVFFDPNPSTRKAVKTPAVGCFYAGKATRAKTSGQTTVLVDLNAQNVNLGLDVILTALAGIPVDGAAGTAAGVAGKGSLCVDATNGRLYQNTGTKAEPAWTLVGSESAAS